MANYANGFVVTLDKDIHEDDIPAIISALQMIKHVASVKECMVDFKTQISQERAKSDISKKFIEF